MDSRCEAATPQTPPTHLLPLLDCQLQVYYLYRIPVYLQTTFPTLFGSMHMLRLICIREGITLVHAHQAFSTMGLEACLSARTMGYKVRPLLKS